MDVARTEQIESDLNRLIEKRHDQRVSEEQGRIEDEWAESCRRHAEEERKEKLIDRYLYHEEHIGRLDRTFGVLRVEHEAKWDRAAAALLAHGINAQTLLENPNGKDAA